MARSFYLRVNYDANGGSGAPNGFYRRFISDDLPFTTQYSVSSGVPTRANYNFLGWAQSASATTAQYTSGSKITFTWYGAEQTNEITLYAVWQRIYYTVSFNANGGSNPPSSMYRASGSYNNLPSEVPTREGYKFVGWSKYADRCV